MSCLSLPFPVSPRRAWKGLKSKLQTTRLWKPQRSKTIKKPKDVLNPKVVIMKASNKHSLFRNKRRRRKGLSSSKQFYLNKVSYAPPVYVDRLFKEAAAVPETVWNFQPLPPPPPLPTTTTATTAKEGGVKGLERACGADDIWESLALASPLIEGINERAEEFILRFRAEMELEETMARNLWQE